jgi:hypothetical protein
MPKHLITAIGLIVSLGVIALGVVLVAIPLYFQAVSVDSQTAQVASTNSIYQAQLDSLREQEANLDEINAQVETLRAQIPGVGQLDDVFEVVGRAAEASGVVLVSVTAGEQVAFAARTGAEEEQAVAPAPAPETTPTPGPTDSDAVGEAESGAVTADVSGRQQVDFVIGATASDMAQVTAFLDALRAGPRLLNSIEVTTTQTGEGTIDVQVSANTFVDQEG